MAQPGICTEMFIYMHCTCQINKYEYNQVKLVISETAPPGVQSCRPNLVYLMICTLTMVYATEKTSQRPLLIISMPAILSYIMPLLPPWEIRPTMDDLIKIYYSLL